MDFSCPSCKSDNIQRLSVIYEGGLSEINTRSNGTGIGIGRGGLGVGVGSSKTRGTSQTAASQRAAPPERKRYLKPLGLMFLAFFLSVLFFGSSSKVVESALTIAWLAGSVYWCYFAFQYNSKTWPPLKAAWDNSYLCNRCNEIFGINAA